MDFEDIIRHETESTYCDFKATQYPTTKHQDFLIDIISFANADILSDRFIVIGVKHKNTEEKNFGGITKEEFINPAIYQQIVHQNVDPDINFDYKLFELDGKYFGIFHIINCDEQPYVMKKDFGSLKKGDSWIRKGRHNTRMERKDYEKIYDKRKVKSDFSGNVDIFFTESQSTHIILRVAQNILLPSEIAHKKILFTLGQRQQNLAFDAPYQLQVPLFRKKKIEEMSTIELKDELEHLKERYEDWDNYTIFEENSNKVNLTIANNGTEYIVDCRVELEIPKKDGLMISENVYEEPDDSLIRPAFQHPRFLYPKVECRESIILISQNTGDIRHKIPTEVFELPLRIVLFSNLIGQEIECECRIYGKNLQSPIERKLKMIVKSAK